MCGEFQSVSPFHIRMNQGLYKSGVQRFLLLPTANDSRCYALEAEVTVYKAAHDIASNIFYPGAYFVVPAGIIQQPSFNFIAPATQVCFSHIDLKPVCRRQLQTTADRQYILSDHNNVHRIPDSRYSPY